ncbi:LysM peptidoglycan-binding domain-containing protein [Candidatus Saccharibacteria bacterium]|nr:MAG: LysM peptidoglycan-binding domain-containing protein [Candidatus Saccharibacteria bacterium]
MDSHVELGDALTSSPGDVPNPGGGSNPSSDDSPTPGDVGRVETVRPGDTLSKIALRHGTTVEELVRLNNIQNPDLIFPDQAIKLPNSLGGAAQARLTQTEYRITL